MKLLERVRPRREVTLGPVRLKEGTLVMRSPRLRDAPAWSAARLANREWLERAFPAWGDDWAAEQQPVAWVERWWHLRSLRRHQDARPFVLLLDGELIGELGVDAVDAASGGGEASVWMVRDHGSAGVMNVASLLLIQHAFNGAGPMDRLISPVATTSRKGRTPGLTAVGFDIEATLPRPVGRGDAVDHDIWILHNAGPIRAKADQALAAMTRAATSHGDRPAPQSTPGRLPSVTDVVALAPAVARALVRAGRASLQSASERRRTPVTATRHADVDGVRVAVDATGVVMRNGRPVGHLASSTDTGTATATLRPRVDNRAADLDAAGVIAAAAGLLADDVATWAPGARWVQVRVTPDLTDVRDALAAHGFEHVATYRGNPVGTRRWTGEHLWSRAV